MRFLVGALAILAAGMVTPLFADPPAAPAAAAAAAPSAPVVPSVSASAPAAPAAAPANAASVTSASATPADEKALLAQGFKPRTRSGQKVYCREEPVLGSRVRTTETCGTPEQLKARTDSAREATEASQRIQVNKSGS